MKYIKRFEGIDWNFIEEEKPDIMSEFEGHEDFYNYLVDNNALDKYIKNLQDDGKELKKFLKYSYREEFIDLAFTWVNTPDGENFWYDLHNKWVDIVKNRKTN